MKSKMKRRMLAIVLCMVIALSNSSFIFASSGTEEPAAVAQEGDPQNVQETQTEAAVQDTPAVLSETTPEATPEATPEPTQVPEVTAAPTEAPQATAEPTQAPEVTAAPDVFCQVLFPEKSVGIPFFQQGIFPAFSGHYASLRMRACSIR